MVDITRKRKASAPAKNLAPVKPKKAKTTTAKKLAKMASAKPKQNKTRKFVL
jgi:hypothetical protein